MSSGTTPGRTTVLTLNTPVTIPMQGLWSNDLSMSKISPGKLSTNGDGSGHPNGNYRVQFFNQIGWKLQDYQSNLSFTHETTVTDGQNIPGGWAAVGAGSGFQGIDTHITPSWLTGLGTTTSAPGPNDTFNQKSVLAGGTVAQRNAGDQASYPSVTAPGLDVPLALMDRAFTGTGSHHPDQDIWFRFKVPQGSPYQTAQALCILYFCGMPTVLKSDGASPGNGQYSLIFWADGTAYLMENTSPTTWVFRNQYIFSPPQQVNGRLHMIHVHQDAFVDSSGNWSGSVIQVEFATVYNALQTIIATAIDILKPQYQTYLITQYSPAQPKLVPVRLDIRRDIFVDGHLQTSLYYSVGYLVTAVQSTPGFEPRDPLGSPTSTLLNVAFYGSYPEIGCEIKVYEQTSGLPLTQSGPTNNFNGVTWASFICPLNATTTETKFYAILKMISGTGQNSPIVNRCTFTRNPIGKIGTPTPIDVPILSSVSMSGSDRDFTHETAAFIMPDPQGILDPILTVQGGQPYRLKTFYDPDNPSKFSYLQTGRLMSAKRLQKGNYASLPQPNYGTYQALGVGEWSTLTKRTTYYVLNFAASNEEKSPPWKVTEAIKALFRAAGYFDTQIDVPDLSIRFFTGKNPGNSLEIESYSPIGPIIAQYARDWLGAFVRWDPNYTNGGPIDDENGCWRVILPPKPVGLNIDGLPGYNYACQFLTSPPPGCAGVVYPPIIAYNHDGSNMVQAPCRKFSYSTQIIPPAGNCVMVSGVGQAGGGVISTSGGIQLVAKAHNWAAGNFGQNHATDGHPNPDPTHPDWTDGIPELIYYSDPALVDQKAVNFICRRIFDFSCHAQEFVILEAPLVLISPQPGDTKWIRPRPLAFGDPVLLNGKPYFIWSAPSGKWWEGKGNQQQAMYELRSVPAMTAEYTHSGLDEQYKAIASKVS